ncbi:MAG: helix-turn-helix transcriptional regulator [Firmicutes bacterium]|nr:helix-turn-helix transcriptional regulator [Bacillota bacterium]
MEIRLAENIRTFRKERSLTQKQLAEALGVTVGAVYKWEAKLSLPELGLIVEMADFFDTSVDVLLGYKLQDNHLRAAADRLQECRSRKDRAGLAEAEKALKKYPNSFEIVYGSARIYRVFGVEEQNETLLRRALELLEQARLLLQQNTDPTVNESVLFGETAEILISLGDSEQAVGILKKHNADGIYNDLIGLTLASDCKRPVDAQPYLDEALLKTAASLIRIITGYLNLYFEQRGFASAQGLLQWGISVFSGLTDGGRVNFLWKICSVLYVCLAHAQVQSGDHPAAW